MCEIKAGMYPGSNTCDDKKICVDVTGGQAVCDRSVTKSFSDSNTSEEPVSQESQERLSFFVSNSEQENVSSKIKGEGQNCSEDIDNQGSLHLSNSKCSQSVKLKNIPQLALIKSIIKSDETIRRSSIEEIVKSM